MCVHYICVRERLTGDGAERHVVPAHPFCKSLFHSFICFKFQCLWCRNWTRTSDLRNYATLYQLSFSTHRYIVIYSTFRFSTRSVSDLSIFVFYCCQEAVCLLPCYGQGRCTRFHISQLLAPRRFPAVVLYVSLSKVSFVCGRCRNRTNVPKLFRSVAQPFTQPSLWGILILTTSDHHTPRCEYSPLFPASHSISWYCVSCRQGVSP